MPVIDDRLNLKSLHPQTVWVPKVLATGSLHPMTVLKAVAGLSRRDNQTSELTWRNADVNARCGTVQAKNGMHVLADLAEAGVVTSYRQRQAGAPYTVTFAATDHRQRIEIPQAALWPFLWVHGNVTGPRYGARDTAQVLRWLTAVLVASDYQPGNLRVVHDLGAADICKRSGLSRDAYERAWAVVRRVCKADPWIKWEGTVWEDGGGHGPNILTIDWTLLPALLPPPAKATRKRIAEVSLIKNTPALSAGRGVAGPADTARHFPQVPGGTFSGNSSKEASSFPQFSPHTSIPPVPAAATSPTEPAPTGGKGEESEEGEMTVEGIRLVDVLASGLRSEHVGGSGTDKTTADLDTWTLTLVAALVDSSTANRIPLRRAEIPAIKDLFQAQYDAGWSATILAERLTEQSSPTQNALGALRYRRDHKLPDLVNYRPGARTTNQLADDAAYEAAASSRNAKKYHRTTM